MQILIPKLRQTSIISKEPDFLFEKFLSEKLWRAPTIMILIFFTKNFAHVFYLVMSTKGCVDFFYLV